MSKEKLEWTKLEFPCHVRLYQQDFDRNYDWLMLLKALGIPPKDYEKYYTVLVDITAWSDYTGEDK